MTRQLPPIGEPVSNADALHAIATETLAVLKQVLAALERIEAGCAEHAVHVRETIADIREGGRTIRTEAA